MDLTLIKACNNKYYSRAEDKDFTHEFGMTKVYKVKGNDDTLYYWNSSNTRGINHDEALHEITNELLDNYYGGEVIDGWNNIMFDLN